MRDSPRQRTDQYFAGTFSCDPRTSDLRIHTTSEQVNATIDDWRRCKDELRKRLVEENRLLDAARTVKLADNAPINKVTLVFTDIENSTALWEQDASAMSLCLLLHNSLLRGAMVEYNGYEVKTEGDAFMVAFKEPHNAVEFCVHVQRSLMHLDWPTEFVKTLAPTVIDDNGELLFHGVRVRMGVHTGFPICQRDPTSGRMDYFGRMVNKAARLGGLARAGQILVSDAIMDDVLRHLNPVEVKATPLGRKVLKGIKEEMTVFELLPKQLAGRSAYFARLGSAQPHILIQRAPSVAPKFLNQTAPAQLNELLKERHEFRRMFKGEKSLTEMDFEASGLFKSRGINASVSGPEQDPELQYNSALQTLQEKYDDAIHQLEALRSRTLSRAPLADIGTESPHAAIDGRPSSASATDLFRRENFALRAEREALLAKIEGLESDKASLLKDRAANSAALHDAKRTIDLANQKIRRLEMERLPHVTGPSKKAAAKKNPLWEVKFASEYWVTKSFKVDSQES